MTCPEMPAGVVVPDALAEPDARLIAAQALLLLPRGRAWQSDEHDPGPDPDTGPALTVMRQFWRGVGHPLAALFRRLWLLVLAATASTAPAEALPDWERDHGLPDECLGLGDHIEARRRAVLLRLRGPYGPRVEDYECWLASHGAEVLIEEPFGFEAGGSECGGADEIGLPEHVLRLVLAAGVVDRFEAGAGECGLDPLGASAVDRTAPCALARILPAHLRLDVVIRPATTADRTTWTADTTALTADAET